MRPALPTIRLAAAACALLATPVLAPAQTLPALDKAKDLCMGRASSLEERMTGCTALIDAKAATGHDLAVALCNRGYVLTERKDYQRALADLEAGIEADRTYPCLFVNRGRAFGFLDQFDKAIADYDEAIPLDRNFALPHNNRGDAWRHKGDLDRAIADFSVAIRINPQYALAYGNPAEPFPRKPNPHPALQ